MVGPPRAIEIKSRAEKNKDELTGQPLWLVLCVEFILRGSMLLLLAVALESLAGDLLYEQYRLDIFFAALIASGVCHSSFYYLAFGVLKKDSRSSARTYRLGRNFAYAVIPAFLAAGITLIWQDFNQKSLFEGELVEMTFFITWGVFLVAGLVEAMIASRRPTGLGEKLHDELQGDR
jgi:hypothetical protein